MPGQRRLALLVLLGAAAVAIAAFPWRATWWGGWILAIAEAGVGAVAGGPYRCAGGPESAIQCLRGARGDGPEAAAACGRPKGLRASLWHGARVVAAAPGPA